ncbi:16S rRNA (uracil(1498)-N(3))-methyltransferase [Deinococcus ficus]|uniref:16S rRNA (uracil(1498)-N(3))-methyltransferase n=1 Tax=Deinococcus ficus TaxID=317577 RepID=UPI0003B2F287|nr:16S rRNA (uracil(1498)-N(3))-methyltransferase [Deinococcus ficus]
MSGGKPRHRLPVPELADVMVLGPAEARHLGVLRLAPGAAVVVFDGRGGEARATVAELDDTRAVLHLGEATQGAQETPQPLTLAASLLKGDKLAEVVRAATELGVARIQLVVPRRADAREIGAQKLQRLARVAQEASKQSRRAVIPEVLAPVVLDALAWEGTLLVAQPGSAVRVMDVVDWTRPVTVLTGPEGGLTPEEVAALVARGAQAVTLGPRILRAETAPVALLGAIAALGQ